MNLDFVPASMFSWVASPDGGIVEDCVHWRKFTGQSRAEAKEFGWLRAVHPEERETVARTWAASVAELNAFEARFRVRRVDHTYHWFEGRALPVLDNEGRILEWRGLSWERQLPISQEKGVGEDDALYRAIAANFPKGAVFVVDTQFRYRLVDGPGLQEAGMVPSDFEGKTLWEALPPDLAAQHERDYRAVLAGNSFRHEHEVNNQVYLSHGVPLRNEKGAVHLALVVSYNITERKRAEKRLQLFERVSQITRTAGDADIIMADTARLLGEHMDATGCAYAEMAPDQGQLAVRHLWAAQEGAVIAAEHVLGALEAWTAPVRRTGTPYVIADLQRAHGNTVKEEGGLARPITALICCPLVRERVLVAVLLVFQDVPRDWTEDEVALVKDIFDRSWGHVERARMAEALRQADQNKNEFLATLSHELRNPLAPLSTGLTLLKGASLDPTVADIVVRMERQLGTMIRLVDDLLDVSRISQGKVEVRPEKTVLQHAMHDAVDATRVLIEKKNQSLTLRLHAAPLYMHADPVRLTQIVSNVLNNAAKYTPPDGRIEVSAAVEHQSVVIQITDSGAGIPQDMLSKIFDKFTQIAATRMHSAGGLGVGLALTKELVELHHGTITAQSAGPGLGSTFTIRLPLLDVP